MTDEPAIFPIPDGETNDVLKEPNFDTHSDKSDLGNESSDMPDVPMGSEGFPISAPDNELRQFITLSLENLRNDLCAVIERSSFANSAKDTQSESDKETGDPKEQLLNKMHDELQRWRSNFYQNNLLNPIYLGLLEAYDLVVNAGRGGDPEEQLRELPDHIEGIFQNLGFDIIRPEIGFPVKPGERSLKIVRTLPAPSPEQDRTVAAVHKNGFSRLVEKDGNTQFQLLRPAWVTMYLYHTDNDKTNINA